MNTSREFPMSQIKANIDSDTRALTLHVTEDS
jgi:hypothetical protein